MARGDTVTLDLRNAGGAALRPSARAHGRRAGGVRRGPLIYCVEEADNPGGPVQTLALPRSGKIDVEWRPDLFGGVMTSQRGRETAGSGQGSGHALFDRAARDGERRARRAALFSGRTAPPGRCRFGSPRVTTERRLNEIALKGRCHIVETTTRSVFVTRNFRPRRLPRTTRHRRGAKRAMCLVVAMLTCGKLLWYLATGSTCISSSMSSSISGRGPRRQR